jgi:hypothetical protein
MREPFLFDRVKKLVMPLFAAAAAKNIRGIARQSAADPLHDTGYLSLSRSFPAAGATTVATP